MKQNIKYGNSTIEFSLKRSKRKTMAISVYPDQSVEVIAPPEATAEKIYAKLLKRASWIIRKQMEFSRMQPTLPAPSYLAGETYRYLGRQYRLKFETAEKNRVVLKGRFLIVSSPDPGNMDRVKKAVINWYRTRAESYFKKRIDECVAKAYSIGIKEVPEWKMRVMRKRWGSCTRQGILLLHPELITAPRQCIEYVIFHELCHMVEYNHSPRFYLLLEKVLPGWKNIRRRLNETIEVRLM